MRRATFMHGATTAALLGAVTYLFVQSTSVDPAEHVRMLQEINSLSEIDSDVRRTLLLIRTGLLLHYDTLNDAVESRHEQLETLTQEIGSFAGKYAAEAAAGLETLSGILARQDELVERFKSNHALVRNSWAYVAERSRTFEDLTRASLSSDEVARTMSQLLPAMLHVLRHPERDSTEVAATLLQRLERSEAPSNLRPHVTAMVAHGRIILELFPELDSTFRTLLIPNTARATDKLRANYLEQHRLREDRAEQHRILLYATSLLLFIYLGYLFLRLRTNARELARLNQGLRDEMAERKQIEKRNRELDTELYHAHRLSLLGEMASGLAHELNQPLTAIRLYARGCARRLRAGEGTPEEISAAMEQLSTEVLRAGEIVNWIRGFVKKKTPQPSCVDVNARIAETVDLLGHELKNHDISIVMDLSPGLPEVQADRIEIQQIVLNLAKNSMEAMTDSDRDRRVLRIATSIAEADVVEVVVKDTGPGMDPGVLEHAFDSFFTTKPRGMGLGLSICRSMVEAHGGRLWATSETGRGTSFHFTLPVAREGSHEHV